MLTDKNISIGIQSLIVDLESGQVKYDLAIAKLLVIIQGNFSYCRTVELFQGVLDHSCAVMRTNPSDVTPGKDLTLTFLKDLKEIFENTTQV